LSFCNVVVKIAFGRLRGLGGWPVNSSSSNEEISKFLNGLGKITIEAHEEFEATRQPAYFPNEEEALAIGIRKFWNREQTVRDEAKAVAARAALLDAKEWI
jgi:hypothetical protein